MKISEIRTALKTEPSYERVLPLKEGELVDDMVEVRSFEFVSRRWLAARLKEHEARK